MFALPTCSSQTMWLDAADSKQLKVMFVYMMDEE